jgi:hypothetical protein
LEPAGRWRYKPARMGGGVFNDPSNAERKWMSSFLISPRDS